MGGFGLPQSLLAQYLQDDTLHTTILNAWTHWTRSSSKDIFSWTLVINRQIQQLAVMNMMSRSKSWNYYFVVFLTKFDELSTIILKFVAFFPIIWSMESKHNRLVKKLSWILAWIISFRVKILPMSKILKLFCSVVYQIW